MKSPILSFENVTYQYPDGTMAIKDITLSIARGKKIALLGNNGAGKSTLFLLFNGILKPTNGCIKFKGNKLSYTRKEIRQIRQQVGIVFQNPETQLFSANVYEDIKFGPKNLGMPPEEIEKIVQETMNLTETDFLKVRPPHRLSVGQKKLVAIAGVVAMKPDLMVLDEPTAGLDPYYSKKIIHLMNNLHNENNRTIVLSTHDVVLAYEWADEVVILNDGQIISQGNPIEVFQNHEVIKQSHIEQPWVMKVFDMLTENKSLLQKNYPKSQEALYEVIKSINRF